jgi:hypothetical protein
MFAGRRRLFWLGSLAILLVIFGGSVVFWLADGAVGTPEEFRDRVASIGLEVDWTNVGPRAGEGSIETECGNVSVTLNEINGDLWLATTGDSRQITTTVIDELMSCQGQ